MSSAGTAYVDIEARTDDVASAIESALSSVDGTVDVTAEADVSAAEAELESLGADPIDIPVDATVDAAQAEIDSVGSDPIDIPVTANTEQAQASIDDLSGSIGSMADAVGAGGGALGGMSSELAGLAGASSGAAAGVAALVGGLGLSVGAAAEAEAVNAKLAQILDTTGAGAYVTQGHINDLSSEIMAYSGQSDEAINSAATLLLTFQGLSNEASINAGILDRATVATADIAALMGGEASDSALRLGRALDDPVRGMSMLQRSGISFTQAQKDMIQSMAESGDMLGAQAALLDVVESQVGGLAEAYGDTLSGKMDIAGQAAGELAEAVGGDLVPAFTSATTDITAYIEALQSAKDGVSGWADGLVGEIQSLGAESALESLPIIGPIVGSIDIFRDAMGSANTDIRGVGEVIGELPPPLQSTADAADEAAGAIDDLTSEISDYLSSIQDVPGAQRDLQQSMSDLHETNQRLVFGEASFYDLADAQDDVVTSTAQLIEKMIEQGASHAALDTTIQDTILMLRGERDAGNITQQQFADLTAEIQGIPTKAETAVSAPGLNPTYGTATNYRHLMNDLDGDTVLTHYVADGLNRIYMDTVNYRAIMNDLDGRTVTTYYKSVGSPIAKNASGTESAAPGLSWVGEEGPELIALSGGERIWSNAESVRIANAGGDALAGTSITVNIHGTATQADGQAVVDALRRWQQRNGPVPVKVSA